jgi:hypothetical protein
MTRKGTTVTVKVSNPMEATHEELLAALTEKNGYSMKSEKVEWINWRNKDGRVCFAVTWEAI